MVEGKGGSVKGAVELTSTKDSRASSSSSSLESPQILIKEKRWDFCLRWHWQNEFDISFISQKDQYKKEKKKVKWIQKKFTKMGWKYLEWINSIPFPTHFYNWTSAYTTNYKKKKIRHLHRLRTICLGKHWTKHVRIQCTCKQINIYISYNALT